MVYKSCFDICYERYQICLSARPGNNDVTDKFEVSANTPPKNHALLACRDGWQIFNISGYSMFQHSYYVLLFKCIILRCKYMYIYTKI